MEVLFSSTLASYEAWIMILCLVLLLTLYLSHSISFITRIYNAIKPPKPLGEDTSLIPVNTIEIKSPILEPIGPEEIQAHEAEKVKAEEKHEQEILESEIFEEKVLENIIEQKITDTHESIESEVLQKESLQKVDAGYTTRDDENLQKENTQETDDNCIDQPIPIDISSNTDTIDTITTDISGNIIGGEPVGTNYDLDAGERGDIKKGESLQSEESPALPITASIQEYQSDIKRSNNPQYTEKLYTLVSEVKTLLARGLSQEARALIIEGLSLDKNHRELNLILGSIYEGERQAQKAEYIYKDLALIYPEDGEILEKLANILIIEKRYDIAFEIYKKIVLIGGETEGSLYIMTHLAQELGDHEELYTYACRYQKNWPNNPDILTLLAQAEIALGMRQSAIQTLIKIKNLTPYNNEIMETIAKLTMEEELAGNFTSQK